MSGLRTEIGGPLHRSIQPIQAPATTPTLPHLPNASMRNIAGVCDPTGRVFGLMPHPEANHSTWLGPHGQERCPNMGKVKGNANLPQAVKFAREHL
ncbi:MAG: hypothetical protein Ct9H90mP16_14700 [Candidatus Poseidoniales archaeon]|nr:MAG: hypothetical protein Ct9H90mP16_14700 [Candidatus Poseidoniales archaeon]